MAKIFQIESTSNWIKLILQNKKYSVESGCV